MLKVSEKSLELNVGAELLGFLRHNWGMPKAYLRGLTQREEKLEGVDFFAHLDPATRIFAFQFKAPKGTMDAPPYRYTLKRRQHDLLFSLAKDAPGSVFYVFPYYVTPVKLHQDVPDLAKDTWLLDLHQIETAALFGNAETKTIRCTGCRAEANPTYEMSPLRDILPSGMPVQKFASWYGQYRNFPMHDTDQPTRQRDSWIARGLRVAIVLPENKGNP